MKLPLRFLLPAAVFGMALLASCNTTTFEVPKVGSRFDDTKKYLKRHIFQICLFSSFVMGGCVLFSLILQMRGIMSSTLAMLPTSFMILMGLWSNLYNESAAVIHTDSYRTFI